MPEPDRHNLSQLSPASLRALKRVMQHLHGHDLRPGDRLAPQAELCRLLGTNNDSLTPAMRLLTERGVVVRKSRVGTVVVDRDALGPLPWSIGVANIAAPETGPTSIFTILGHHLQVRFARLGWRSRSYYHLEARRNHLPRIHEFGGLTEDLRADAVDGLVLLTGLAREDWRQMVNAGQALAHLLFWETAPCGVVIDQGELAREAVRWLVQQNCRRLAVVSMAAPDQFTHRFRDGFEIGLSKAGLPANAGRILTGGGSIEGGQNVAQQLLAMRKIERPDGLIVLDDYIALGLIDTLRDHGPADYRPRIAVQTCRQLPLTYRLPVIRFEVDIAELCDRTIACINAKLLNPQGPDLVDWVVPVATETETRAASVITAC